MLTFSNSFDALTRAENSASQSFFQLRLTHRTWIFVIDRPHRPSLIVIDSDGIWKMSDKVEDFQDQVTQILALPFINNNTKLYDNANDQVRISFFIDNKSYSLQFRCFITYVDTKILECREVSRSQLRYNLRMILENGRIRVHLCRQSRPESIYRLGNERRTGECFRNPSGRSWMDYGTQKNRL